METGEVGNFEEYCECLGISWVKRLLSPFVCPCQTISVNGDCWSILTSCRIKQTDIQLTVGQECTWLTFDGRKIRTSVDLEDGRLTLRQLDPPHINITREFTSNTMVMTLEVHNVKARRIYKKQDNTTSRWSRTLLFLSFCLSTASVAWYWKQLRLAWL
ncbi:sodium/calcium exchanger regulatory protein 1-like [Argopecten irradians]|uniref:sodium/calcium exchanger regulatory protein 1-like n=1 Tax=Argopecten irradians TaxID=31199 RepID=UPI00371A60CF